MSFWMIWSLYIIIQYIFKAIWFVLKWTFFLVPTLAIKGVPLLFKSMYAMLIIIFSPFILIYECMKK
jgi:hypothetical protein